MISDYAGAMRMRSQQEWLAWLAVFAGAAGVLSAIPMGALPRSLLLLVLMLFGAGSATMCWLDLPTPAAVAGAIGLSVLSVVVVATAMAWLRWWYPIPAALVLSVGVSAVGGLRLWLARGVDAGSQDVSG